MFISALSLLFVNIKSQVDRLIFYFNRLSNGAINVWNQNSIKFKFLREFTSLINIFLEIQVLYEIWCGKVILSKSVKLNIFTFVSFLKFIFVQKIV